MTSLDDKPPAPRPKPLSEFKRQVVFRQLGYVPPGSVAQVEIFDMGPITSSEEMQLVAIEQLRPPSRPGPHEKLVSYEELVRAYRKAQDEEDRETALREKRLGRRPGSMKSRDPSQEKIGEFTRPPMSDTTVRKNINRHLENGHIWPPE